MTGCFGWMLFGKFKQNALMRKLLRDPYKLAGFIQSASLKKIATDGEKLRRKGNSYRNNLDDVVAINAFALDSTKYQYLFFTVAGLIGGFFIHRYVFLADLAIIILVANMRIPKQLAEWGLKDIYQIIVIVYRLRQEEPVEYMKLSGEHPAYRIIGTAIVMAEKTLSTQSRILNPEFLESMKDLGRLHYCAGITDSSQWHSVMLQDAESIQNGFGKEVEPLLNKIWAEITGEGNYAGECFNKTNQSSKNVII